MFGLGSFRLATPNPCWTRFGATNKAIYCIKKPCWFFNHLRFFNLSMPLFVRSKFVSNLLTHNRRGHLNWERRRNIKIFQAFIGWKAPSIMRYRRVQYGLGVAMHCDYGFGVNFFYEPFSCLNISMSANMKIYNFNAQPTYRFQKFSHRCTPLVALPHRIN